MVENAPHRLDWDWQLSNPSRATAIGRRSGFARTLVKLSISQITDDAVDQLFGGGDTDWYLTNTASEVKGATRDESIN